MFPLTQEVICSQVGGDVISSPGLGPQPLKTHLKQSLSVLSVHLLVIRVFNSGQSGWGPLGGPSWASTMVKASDKIKRATEYFIFAEKKTNLTFLKLGSYMRYFFGPTHLCHDFMYSISSHNY